MKNHFKKLEEMYLKANINSIVFDSSTILIKEGEAKISLAVSRCNISICSNMKYVVEINWQPIYLLQLVMVSRYLLLYLTQD